MLDYSAQPVPEAVYSDLDPVEREHLRSIIQNYHGEKTLLDLDDTELDLALRLAIEQNGVFVPTYCGMLLIGRRERLSMLVPTAEATFQELQGTDVVANESFILPMLQHSKNRNLIWMQEITQKKWRKDYFVSLFQTLIKERFVKHL